MIRNIRSSISSTSVLHDFPSLREWPQLVRGGSKPNLCIWRNPLCKILDPPHQSLSVSCCSFWSCRPTRSSRRYFMILVPNLYRYWQALSQLDFESNYKVWFKLRLNISMLIRFIYFQHCRLTELNILADNEFELPKLWQHTCQINK